MSENTLGPSEHARAVERRSVVEEKLRDDVRKMLVVLRADIPGFFAREAKRRFVASPEFAERLSEDQLKKLKAKVQEAADLTAADVCRALEEPKVWSWDHSAPLPESPKGLDGHPRVSAVLSRIGLGLAQVLAQLGFPDAESAKESYKLPTYFIAGHFMKQLVESYWRNLQEQVELTKLIDESSTRERRENLTRKWDQA